MEIQWLGGTSFLIKNSIGKRLLIDPYIIDRNNNLSSITPNAILLSKQSIYNSLPSNFLDICPIIKENKKLQLDFCYIEGFPSFQDNEKGRKRGINFIYKIYIDGFSICHLGNLGHILDSKFIEMLGKIDILFIPVGGQLSLNGKDASILTKLINPSYTIPMQYKTKIGPPYLDGVNNYIKKMNYHTELHVNPLKINKKSVTDSNKILLIDLN